MTKPLLIRSVVPGDRVRWRPTDKYGTVASVEGSDVWVEFWHTSHGLPRKKLEKICLEDPRDEGSLVMVKKTTRRKAK
jgi:hypothetical protein